MLPAKRIIVTNNPLPAKEMPAEDVVFHDESVEALFIRLRDKVHQGYPLLTHPLAASIRMIYSPYRSVLIGSEAGEVDADALEMMETSIQKYKALTGERLKDAANAEAYKWIDLQLLIAAMNE